ncbi:hypothetical protein GCM10008967_29020 [Bacillus carboniphilus]|uniref:WYL domain-containing protein n=1 Tax=Bacillus carboniphilus TaxID=86663 RepID=A0ABN0WGP5_9BACI
MKKRLIRWQLEGIPVEIIYESKSHTYTQRKIKIMDIQDERVVAYCFLRDQIRTFNLEQILSVFPVGFNRNKSYKNKHRTKTS